MATKYQNTFQVMLVAGDGDYTVSDSAEAAGVWASLQAREDVTFTDTTGDNPLTVFIPFHAVTYANLQVTRAEVEAPADATCPE